MVEPIQVPGTPMFSTSNITGSPITTVAGVLAAVAQYLTINGATMPSDAQGWASFAGGLILAILLALYRGTSAPKAAAPIILLAFALGACNKGNSPPPPPPPPPHPPPRGRGPPPHPPLPTPTLRGTPRLPSSLAQPTLGAAGSSLLMIEPPSSRASLSSPRSSRRTPIKRSRTLRTQTPP
jgi:hypothetical protein